MRSLPTCGYPHQFAHLREGWIHNDLVFTDVLDAMGKSPREFCGVHVHFESVQLVDGRRFIGNVLLQSAYEPVPRVKLVLTCLSSRRELERLELPSLNEGRVVRVRVPMRLEPQEQAEFSVHLDGPEPRGRRVRTAWKLDAATSFQLEPALRAPAVDGTTLPLDGPSLELLWRPGQKVPQPPSLTLTPIPPPRPVRWCRTCGFEGLREEMEHLRQCPQCDEPWL